jgi:hypothetical protein
MLANDVTKSVIELKRKRVGIGNSTMRVKMEGSRSFRDGKLYGSDRFRDVDRRICGWPVHGPRLLHTLNLVLKNNAESVCTVGFPHEAGTGVFLPHAMTSATPVIDFGDQEVVYIALPGLYDLEDKFQSQKVHVLNRNRSFESSIFVEGRDEPLRDVAISRNDNLLDHIHWKIGHLIGW